MRIKQVQLKSIMNYHKVKSNLLKRFLKLIFLAQMRGRKAKKGLMPKKFQLKDLKIVKRILMKKKKKMVKKLRLRKSLKRKRQQPDLQIIQIKIINSNAKFAHIHMIKFIKSHVFYNADTHFAKLVLESFEDKEVQT